MMRILRDGDLWEIILLIILSCFSAGLFYAIAEGWDLIEGMIFSANLLRSGGADTVTMATPASISFAHVMSLVSCMLSLGFLAWLIRTVFYNRDPRENLRPPIFRRKSRDKTPSELPAAPASGEPGEGTIKTQRRGCFPFRRGSG